MDATRLIAGTFLSLSGMGIFFASAGFSVSGPRLPTSPIGYVAWILVLAGLGLLKTGVQR